MTKNLTGKSRLPTVAVAFRQSHSLIPFSRLDQDP